jgi:hypothetical protein
MLGDLNAVSSAEAHMRLDWKIVVCESSPETEDDVSAAPAADLVKFPSLASLGRCCMRGAGAN